MSDNDDKIIIGKGSKYPIEVSVYAFKGTVDQPIKHNTRFAIEMIEKEQYFLPILFVYTKDKMFVLPLSTKLSEDTKSSAADQVVPLLKVLKNNEDRTGKIVGYQVIFEAWMGRTNKKESEKLLKNYKFGDIGKLDQRMDVLLNVVNLNNKDLKTEVYEMIKLESDNKMTVKRVDTEELGMSMPNPKFPDFKDVKGDY